MNKEQIKLNSQIYFTNDLLPYTVRAISDRYAIVVRKLDKEGDADLLAFEVKRGACKTEEEAFEVNKKNPVYSILDFNENWRGPNDRIFSNYDYWKQEDISQCLSDLQSESIFISQRHGCVLEIDWEKTLQSDRSVIHKDWPQSSNVNFTKYYPGKHVLEVNFKSGSYQYTDVPFEIWSDLIAAESVGSFIAKNVKGKFQSVKL